MQFHSPSFLSSTISKLLSISFEITKSFLSLIIPEEMKYPSFFIKSAIFSLSLAMISAMIFATITSAFSSITSVRSPYLTSTVSENPFNSTFSLLTLTASLSKSTAITLCAPR